MTQLNYSTRYINRNYLIKVAGVDNDDCKINTLVGVTGMLALIGCELANKFLDRAGKGMGDNCVCKLRRGIKITFYNK